MPAIAATVSKRTIRRDIARRTAKARRGDGLPLAGYHTRATTSGGSSTTAIIAALSGIGQEYVTVEEPWWLCNDGTNAGEFRRAVTFAGTTVTVGDAYTNTVATAVSMDSYPLPPNLYTEAVNLAIAELYPSVYRIVTSHLIPNGDTYGMPRNMRNASRIEVLPNLIVKDLFNRANDAAAVAGWTLNTGDTLGISSEELYSVTDADGDTVTKDVDLRNGFVQFTTRGTMESSTVYRTFALLFRIREDYAGTLDLNNCLLVRLLSLDGTTDQVQLRKVDGGTESSLATATATSFVDGTNYVVKVDFFGPTIRVWVDDVQLISYQLTGGNLKYLDFPQMGFRLDKAGAPATAARVSEVHAYSAQPVIEWRDWDESRDELHLTIPAYGIRKPNGLLRVEGKNLLTALDADTTAGALTNDSTAVLEITATESGYYKLVQMAAAMLLRQIGSPDAEAFYQTALRMRGMASPMHSFRGMQ